MRREGEPVAEILAAAELVGAEFIVMPTAGRTVFEVLRGSTTERVLRTLAARCSRCRPRAGRESRGYGRVGAATDSMDEEEKTAHPDRLSSDFTRSA